MNKLEVQTIQDYTYPNLINHHGLDDLFLVRLKETKAPSLFAKTTTNRNSVLRSHFRRTLLYGTLSRFGNLVNGKFQTLYF